MGIFYPQVKTFGRRIKLRANADESSYTAVVLTLPSNAYGVKINGRVVTAFTGLTKPKVSLGVTGDTSRYMVAQPIDNTPYEFVMGKHLKSSNKTIATTNFLPDKYKKDVPHSPGFCERLGQEMTKSSGRSIIATFTSSSTDFSGITAGEVEFVITYIDPNEYL